MMTKLLYMLYVLGVLLWQYTLLYTLFLTVRSRFRIRRNLKGVTDFESLRYQSPWQRKLKLLIEGAEAERFFAGPETFLLASGISGAGTALILSFGESLTMALCCGLFMAAMPGGVLLVRLHDRRVARSREGDILVQELLNNYKIYDYNMKEAIEVTAATIEDAPNGKRLLLHLAKGMQTAVSRGEMEKLLSRFRYSLDTAWGNVLATNIFFAHMYGIRVDTALEDLLEGITRSRQVVEHEKRENNEARLMLRYLAPISFLLSIAGACHYFGFTLGKFIRYQFGTPLGLKWFLIMTMLYMSGMLLNGFFSRDKMDI